MTYDQQRQQHYQQSVPQTPLAYFENIKTGFFETKNGKLILKEVLISTDAEKIGETLADRNEKNSMTQIRRFYNDFKAIEARLEVTFFDEEKPFILMMKSKTANAAGSKKISSTFKDFIDKSVDKINDKKSFTAFMKIFESVIGYAVGAGLKES